MACKTVNNVKHYKVKWTGYNDTTWEPAGNIPDELIRDSRAKNASSAYSPQVSLHVYFNVHPHIQ